MTPNLKLKQARLAKIWTLERASREVGVHVTTYNGWELGLHHPHLTTLEMLCKAFGVTAEAIGFAEQIPEEHLTPEPSPLPVSSLILAEYVT